MIENDDVLKIYGIIRNQVVTAGKDGVIIDLEYNALFKIMDLYEIQNKCNVFEQVIFLFHEVLKNQQEDGFQDIREEQ